MVESNTIFIASSNHFNTMKDVTQHLQQKKQYSKVIFQNNVYNIFKGDFGETDYVKSQETVSEVLNG